MGPSGALTTPKLSEPEQVIFEKPNATQIKSESETHQRCSYDMEFTVKGIESASYAVLLSEFKSHTDNGCPLKCRKLHFNDARYIAVALHRSSRRWACTWCQAEIHSNLSFITYI